MALNNINFLSVEDVRHVCYEYAKTHLSFSEPIPSFDLRFVGRLESALGVPPQTFNGELVYPTLAEQAAVLFYHLIVAHPFLNGNKRIACVALLTFYYLNGRWLRLTTKVLYEIALDVAGSKPGYRDRVIEALRRTFDHAVIAR